MIQSEEFMGRKVYSINVTGGSAPPMGVPVPSITIEGDWFLVGLSPENLKDALRAADGEDSGRLSSHADYLATMKPLKGGGPGSTTRTRGSPCPVPSTPFDRSSACSP